MVFAHLDQFLGEQVGVGLSGCEEGGEEGDSFLPVGSPYDGGYNMQ